MNPSKETIAPPAEGKDVRIIQKVSFVLAVGLAIFHVVTGFRMLTAMEQRSIHLGFVLLLIFLKDPEKKNSVQRYADILLGLLGAGACVYVYTQYLAFITTRAGLLNATDIAAGIIITLLVLEAARRTIGAVVGALATIGLLYVVFGHLLPGMAGHSFIKLTRIVQGIGLGNEGVFGSVLGVSADTVGIFIIFAYMLSELGTGQFFIDMANALLGHVRGGPAKIAVISSSLMGTLSGSVTANVVTTGSFTIPLMKKTGYAPEVAASIEAIASTGGSIMPPIMGAAAFLMSDFLGVPYAKVIKAALIPAIMFYVALFVMVDIEAVKGNLKGMPREETPNFWQVFKKGWINLIPLLLLIYLLVFVNVSLGRAAFWSIMVMTVISFIVPSPDKRMTIPRLLTIWGNGAKGLLAIAAICACAGIIVGSLTITGLSLKLSNIIIALAGGNSLLLLIYTAIIAVILSAGMPTTGVYIVLATLIAPALIRMGIQPLAAHLFVFYYGCLAPITPPVAVGSYAAASLAQTDPWKTSWKAVKLGSASFLIPFMFVLWPTLLFEGTAVEIILSLVTGVIGVYCLASAVQGYLRVKIAIWERIVLVAVALGLMGTNTVVNIVCAAVFVLLFIKNSVNQKREKAAA